MQSLGVTKKEFSRWVEVQSADFRRRSRTLEALEVSVDRRSKTLLADLTRWLGQVVMMSRIPFPSEI